MPVIRLAVGNHGAAIPVHNPAGGIINVPRPQFRCLLEVPGFLLPRDAIVDPGAPLIIFPEAIWSRFQPGRDYEFLPFVGPNPPQGRVLSWQFPFQMARFAVPLVVMDTALTIHVARHEVIGAFAAGDPPAPTARKASPPIIIGLWGGILEGGQLVINRDATTGGVSGELHYP